MRLLKLRYSLRTFLVVIAIVAVWFGYHFGIKRDRQALLAVITAAGGEYQTFAANEALHHTVRSYGMDYNDPYLEQRSRISGFRAWLGDAPVCYILISGSKPLPDMERARVYELFPEATIIEGENNIPPKIEFQRTITRSIKQIKEREQQQQGSN